MTGLLENFSWIQLAILACVFLISVVIIRLMTEVLFSMDEEFRDFDLYNAKRQAFSIKDMSGSLEDIKGLAV